MLRKILQMPYGVNYLWESWLWRNVDHGMKLLSTSYLVVMIIRLDYVAKGFPRVHVNCISNAVTLTNNSKSSQI